MIFQEINIIYIQFINIYGLKYFFFFFFFYLTSSSIMNVQIFRRVVMFSLIIIIQN